MDFSQITLRQYPKVTSEWLLSDYWGSLKARSSIGRSQYTVSPGLYKLGSPTKESDVFVSANYKLSFDILRGNLHNINAWILVLDTKGINVWCAAGKGTFGTNELIRQIKDSQLELNVAHKRLIVPQLGAPGISAQEIKKATGFTVKYGPVRAEDIKEYISHNYTKTKEMQTVNFTLKDRLILTPVEIVNSLKYLLYAITVVVLVSILHGWNNGSDFNIQEIKLSISILVTAYISGAFLGPVLLPWLPFKYFGGKGFVIGLITFLPFALFSQLQNNTLYVYGWGLISAAVSSFLTMNFTGASTYTSLSGVKKEMKYFVPFQILLMIGGIALYIISGL